MSTQAAAILNADHFGKELRALVPGSELLDIDDSDLNFVLPTKPDLERLDKLVARALFADPRFRSDMGQYWLLVLKPLARPRVASSLVVRPVDVRTSMYQTVDPKLGPGDVHRSEDLRTFLCKELARLIGHEPSLTELASVTVEDQGDIVYFGYGGRRFMTADLNDPERLRFESWPPMYSQWSMN